MFLNSQSQRVTAFFKCIGTTRLSVRQPATYDWDDIAHVVEQILTEDQTVRYYRHVVIDEGEDFTPAMLRSLALAIPSDGSLTFFGDMAQQICGNRISWRMAGLHPAQPWEFQETYSNTRQIAALCLALTKTDAFKGTVNIVLPRSRRPMGRCLSSSTAPHLRLSVTSLWTTRALALQQSVAILLRRRKYANVYRDTLGRSSVHSHRDLSIWSPQAIQFGHITLPRVLSLMPSSSHSARPSAYQMENVLAHSPAVQMVWRRKRVYSMSA